VWRLLEVGTALQTAILPHFAVDVVSGFEGTIGVVASLETWNGFQPQLEHGEAERDCTQSACDGIRTAHAEGIGQTRRTRSHARDGRCNSE